MSLLSVSIPVSDSLFLSVRFVSTYSPNQLRAPKTNPPFVRPSVRLWDGRSVGRSAAAESTDIGVRIPDTWSVDQDAGS